MSLNSFVGGRRLKLLGSSIIALAVLGLPGFSPVAMASTGFSLGNATNFAIMDEGTGLNALIISNVTVNGSIGIGDPNGHTTTQLQLLLDSVNGSIDFAGSVDDTGTLLDTITGGVVGGDSQVTTDLNYLNSLSSSLATEAATSLSISAFGTETINANSGKLDANGNYVFNVSSFNLNSDTLTINGQNLGHNVVINFTKSGINPNFANSQIVLTGGLTASNVLINVADGDSLNLTNMNVNVTFLDPNGAVTAVGATVTGHIYGGGTLSSVYSLDTVTDNALSPSS
jgi:choice-of-anchor A domain-containing protein